MAGTSMLPVLHRCSEGALPVGFEALCLLTEGVLWMRLQHL